MSNPPKVSDLIDSLTNPSTGLDERESYFLEVLFEQAAGDIRTAMNLAGYPKDHPSSELRKKLAKEIKTRSKDYLLSNTAKASLSLVHVINDPNQIGAKNIISAAKEILDRGDVNKSENMIELPENSIVILPPKRTPNED